jgi:hypothetical protein
LKGHEARNYTDPSYCGNVITFAAHELEVILSSDEVLEQWKDSIGK